MERINKDFTLFKRVTHPLSLLGFSFGYMIVFKDGSYYIFNDNHDFLTNFVKNADRAYIFCKKDITSVSDSGYRFTLWPDLPSDEITEICFKHNQWNGITISKSNENFIELWWFTCDKANTRAQDFFAMNKNVLMKFVHYFNFYKSQIIDIQNLPKEKLFRFQKGFEANIYNLQLQKDTERVKSFLEAMKLKSITIDANCNHIKLSGKEINILSLLSHGYTMKVIARKVSVSPKTVQCHIENIRHKSNLNSREDMIDFYYDKLSRFFE